MHKQQKKFKQKKKQSIFRIICCCQQMAAEHFFFLTLGMEKKDDRFLIWTAFRPRKKRTKISPEWIKTLYIFFLLYALRSLAALLTASLLLHCFLGLYIATGFLYFPHIQIFFSLNFVLSRFRHTFCFTFSGVSLSRFDHCATVQIAPLFLEYNQANLFRKCKGSCSSPTHQHTQTALLQMQSQCCVMEWWWLLVRVWCMRNFQVAVVCVYVIRRNIDCRG